MNPSVPIVFVHVHYDDVWAEMAQEIARAFDRPFGLVLTCRDPAMKLADVVNPHLAFSRRIIVENRGRDVLPFLTALREIGADFDIGLKLHTKRSRHRDDGELWRRFLTGSLLQPGEGSPSALKLMGQEARMGLIAPEAHLLPLQGRIVLNARITRRMIEAMDLRLTLAQLETTRFAAGSMFWFRREALAPFTATDIAPLFAAEKGQLDGTAAHAAERLFSACAERRGYVVTAMEAVSILEAALRDGPLQPANLAAISEEVVARSSNPFILPLAQFWRRHRLAFAAAHHLYARSPRPVWKVARKLLKRFTVDR